jgi:hypothetical protein
MQALLFSIERVANIFFSVLKEVFSKCGCSVVRGKESANCLNVSTSTISQI